jgi:hypothetical protein
MRTGTKVTGINPPAQNENRQKMAKSNLLFAGFILELIDYILHSI